MKRIGWAGTAVLVCLLASSSRAVEPDHFLVRSTADLVKLCSVHGESQHAVEAIHFCHGYVVGAVQYHLAITEPGDRSRLLCIQEPRPDRDSTVAEFVAWAREEPRVREGVRSRRALPFPRAALPLQTVRENEACVSQSWDSFWRFSSQ